jgi:hypothetical protein
LNSLLAALAALLATAPEELRLPPVDQCATDRTFVAWRDKLHGAIERRDAKAVTAELSEDALVDFGGSQGREAFSAVWSLAEPDSSPLWQELAAILKLGCAINGDVRVLPSIVAQVDPDLDAYESVLTIVPGAPVRRERNDTSEVLAQFDWALLRVTSWPDDGDHIRVRLSDGRSGFIRRDHVRSLVDYRMTVAQVHGRWRITSLVAGD